MSKSSSTFVRCRACGHRVYHRARRCPDCGHVRRWNFKPLIVWALAVLLAILLGFGLANWLTDDERPPATPMFDRQ